MCHSKICELIVCSWLLDYTNESFTNQTRPLSLEHPTPVPTLHPASLPLHEFLAYPPQRHILSLSLRDPSDNQNMPANTNAWVQAKTVRGVRKVAIKDWIQWCKDSRPDLIWAFVDIPKTLIVDEGDEGTAVVIGERRQTSQKRITKSLERSIGWIQLLLAGLKDRSSGPKENIDEAENTTDSSLPPIIIPLLGGCDPRAREEFSRSLTEKQDLIDTIRSGGLQRLDDGVFGYAVEMVDLPTNVLRDTALEQDAAPNAFTELLEASLTPLPSTKIRIVHTALSPHAILQLTLKFGFDLFDVPWATEAADLGIALDLQFPVKEGNDESQPIGLNLFDERFGLDLLPLGDADSAKESWPCAPTYEDDKILHSGLDGEQWDDRPGKTSSTVGRPFTRAYIHHLLHTHEMSAYALLHLHNLAIMQAFFKGIRSQVLKDGKEGFKKEVLRFHKKYELPERLFQGARARWKEVELARGKGRLKREREAAANLSDAEMTNIDGIAVAEGIKDAA